MRSHGPDLCYELAGNEQWRDRRLKRERKHMPMLWISCQRVVVAIERPFGRRITNELMKKEMCFDIDLFYIKKIEGIDPGDVSYFVMLCYI